MTQDTWLNNLNAPLIDLRPDHLAIVLELLQEYVPYHTVRAYGSRVKWSAKDVSDLDLAVVGPGPLDRMILASLRGAFEESDLPFSVDVMDWHTIPKRFREEIANDHVSIQSSQSRLTLGDIAEIVMGQSPPGSTVSDIGPVPLLNGPTHFGPSNPTPKQYTANGKKFANVGDLLFCVRGSTGRMNWADQRYAIGRGIAAIKHKSDPSLQPLVRAVLEWNLPTLLTQATGTVFSNVTARQLAALPWPNLNVDQQKQISEILGALDYKIELNRQMSKTLEDMAHALFKSWFIDFDPVRAKSEGRTSGLPPHLDALFPDSFTDSPLGPIPTGWKVSPLVESCSLVMGQSPRSEYYNQLGEGLPFHQGVSDFGNRFPTHRRWTTVDKRSAEPGDILFSVRAPVGRINLALDHLVVGRGLSAIRALDGLQNFVHLQLREMFALEDSIGSGTIYKAVTKRDLESIRLLKPSSPAVKEFESVVTPMANLIAELFKMNCNLREARDLLLPRLISRELDLSKLKSGCFGASA